MTLILAFYSKTDESAVALKALNARRYLRSAEIRRSDEGVITVRENHVGKLLAALGALILVLSLCLVLHLSIPSMLFLGVLGFFAGRWAARRMGLGITGSLVTQYSHWVLNGEALLMVCVSGRRDTRQVLDLLRTGEGNPAIFLDRPTPKGAPLPSERSVPLTAQQLREVALHLPATHKVGPPSGKAQGLLRRLKANGQVLEDVRETLDESARLLQPITPAAEWLLDNSYIIQGHIVDIHRNLPRRYHKVLPVLTAHVEAGGGPPWRLSYYRRQRGRREAGPGTLRIYHLALELIQATDARFTREILIEFLECYQKEAPLTIAELWVFPLMLRFALVEDLAQRGLAVARRQNERERADFWANRLLYATRSNASQLEYILEELARFQTDLPPHFAVRLTGQLLDEEASLSLVQKWLEQKSGTPLQDVIRQEHARQATDQISISNAIGSLRLLAQIDWREVFELTSHVERLLKEDPAGIHPLTDFSTRDSCRQAVEEVARYAKRPELEVAVEALALSRAAYGRKEEHHTGYHLIGEGRVALESRVACRLPFHKRVPRWVRAHPTGFYLGSVGAITSIVLFLACYYSPHATGFWTFAVLGILALFPASEIGLQLVNYFVSLAISPRLLPRLSFNEGIPAEYQTLVVVPMMLLTRDSVRHELGKLEVRYLANSDPNLCFSLLSDFQDAMEQQTPEDAELLEVAVRGIEQLNAAYGANRFFLFHRPRVWSETEQRWMGWERKRGKIEELNCLLTRLSKYEEMEADDGVSDYLDKMLLVGAPDDLRAIRFVITLDADTQLPHDTARHLVETLAHPLNRPQLSVDRRTIVSGYTIIQPRVSTTLPGATATYFTSLFTEEKGTDFYTKAVSDVYQDLFNESIFHGKAIYDLHAFHSVLSKRFPDATLLSHDLIEGCHVRVALASDIELFEQFPVNYQAFSSRQHRWFRGDWQIVDWIFPKVPAKDGRLVPNPLPPINRWQILDNLRRSLVPAASLALLVLSWFLVPTTTVWSVIAGGSLLLPALLPLPARLLAAIKRGVPQWRDQANDLLRTLVNAALLPHLAFIALDAILRVWCRRLISHRDLLQWESAQVAHWRATRQVSPIVFHTMLVSLATALLTIALDHRKLVIWWQAFPFLLVWLLSPLVAHLMNGHKRRRLIPELGREDRAYLRRVARETWRFFDDFVGPESHWLPPDNSQEALRIELAQRTSPTNIGLWLLSALGARDLGYLTTGQMVERALATLDTVERLERHEGHLFNWYDIQTLAPLRPQYISSVDSGNLLASCWLLEQGCLELETRPVLGSEALLGLGDTVQIIDGIVSRDPAIPAAVRSAVTTLAGLLATSPAQVAEQTRLLEAALGPAQQLIQALRDGPQPQTELMYWSLRLERGIVAWKTTVDELLPWLYNAAPLSDALRWKVEAAGGLGFTQAPSLRELAEWDSGPVAALFDSVAHPERFSEGLRPLIKKTKGELLKAREHARALLESLRLLKAHLGQLGEAMNLRYLYDSERRLFTIGYNLSTGAFDSSYYDLLASEARLTSLVAIARGEVPVKHWLALGRPYASLSSHKILLSWSGSMFEYLMPALFTRTYDNSLLDQACQAAVARQIEYGQQRGVPWGISESAFSALDSHHTYQYRAFGVPGLGLKHETDDDVVVAPYATLLALPVAPREAVRNLRKLERYGMRGNKGFYEAIDYARHRSPSERGVIVYAYMAHHQGMSLMALVNALEGAAMQRRFHADPRVRAAEPLLFERIPPMLSETFLSPNPDRPAARRIEVRASELPAIRVNTEDTVIPRAHLLCNGDYSVMITNAGGGYSRWRDFDITRWRADTTRDAWGSFVYVRDVASGQVWSAAYHPVDRPERRYSATFSSDRVEFRRRDAGIETLMEVFVSPEDDAEIRRLTFTNSFSETRRLEVTSYVELALAQHASDRAHPAFSKLFVQTEALPGKNALLSWRRPRSPEETPIWVGHVISVEKEELHAFEYETDRARFVGRGNGLDNPDAMTRRLSGTSGAVLDPALSLRSRFVLEPGQRVRVAFITLAGETRDGLVALVDKYREFAVTARVLELAWARAQLDFRFLGIRAEDAQRFQELATCMLYPNDRLRPPPERLRRNQRSQSALWAHGISGDLPLLLLSVNDANDLAVVREVLVAHTYWRVRGLKVDLVILNEEPGSYAQPLQNKLVKLIQAHSLLTGSDRPGGIFLRSADQLPAEDLTLLLASAHAVLIAARGSLAQQLSRPARKAELPADLEPRRTREEPSGPLPFLELPYFNSLGGFTPDGHEYAIYLGPRDETPAPWCNVIANPTFGALVTESGLATAWCGNSQTNRLTPWLNDPISNAVGEAFYLRDEESGISWTPTPLPIRELDAYRARHGQGYTMYEHNSHAIEQELLVFVPVAPDLPVRIERLRIRNRSTRRRRLSVTAFAEWALGADREDNQLHVVTEWDSRSHSLLARNVRRADYNSTVAFASLVPAANSYTADRAEFLGRNGGARRPRALRRKALSGRTGTGLDPCAALQVTVELAPNEQQEVVFLLGQGANIEETRALALRFQTSEAVEEAFMATRLWWDELLGKVEVETPISSVNFLLNRWLLYQTLSCRVWGRSAFYQSGGAFGFRDQLQDVLALLYSCPALAREHILSAAARQFIEGDVQHWWHPPSGVGVRTLCSDDLLWLPYATARYVRVTGDSSILDEVVPFLEGRPLEPGEHEAYFAPKPAAGEASLVEHCCRAMQRSVSRRGPRGLPLIGSGDWNDGMNRVGSDGKGESVWLAWFLIDTIENFLSVCEGALDTAQIESYRRAVEELIAAVEANAWDGEWYRRAYFDDGTPLGSRESLEARIDSLPQSWAVLSGAAHRERAIQGLRSAEQQLVREADRLILLFDPPFDHSSRHPGYIMGYPPGVRENGGQYTHAALWLAQAFARLKHGTRAVELLEMINPVERTRSAEEVQRYKGEPYVIAADIYRLEGQTGRCGWTWYTGSSGWMYRVWLEEVLGFKLQGDRLVIDPAIPAHWTQYALRYRYGNTLYEVVVENPDSVSSGVLFLEVDGARLPQKWISLIDDGNIHAVRVQLGNLPDDPPQEPPDPGRRQGIKSVPIASCPGGG
jgi:cyclic beta-1,2-glucan synthetase